MYKRAGLMLYEADRLNCSVFITPESMQANNSRLNLAFLANLFNNYPGLQEPVEHEDLYKETREEKSTPPVFCPCILPYSHRISVPHQLSALISLPLSALSTVQLH